jgi:hypothetical protein
MYPPKNTALADSPLLLIDGVSPAHGISTTILVGGFRACFVRVTIGRGRIHELDAMDLGAYFSWLSLLPRRL